MSTASATLPPIPDQFEAAIEITREELEHHVLLMAALKMFELGQISSGKAAQLCGLSRVDFFAACFRYRVSVFNYPSEDLEEELKLDLSSFPK